MIFGVLVGLALQALRFRLVHPAGLVAVIADGHVAIKNNFYLTFKL